MLISASISSVAAGENGLLQNPSFENDSNFWQKKGNATSIGCYTWHKHQGNSSFGIGNDDGPENAYGEIFQELQVPGSIEKGDFFIFNIWVKTEDRYTGKANLEINFLDSDNKLLKTYKSKVLSGRFDWTKVTVKGEAPEGVKKVVVKFVSRDMATGKGLSFIWFDNASIDCPIIRASSSLDDSFLPENMMKGGKWHSEHSDDQWLTIDCREVKKITGLSIDWDKDYASDYELLVSNDEEKWDTVYKAEKNKEGADNIYLNETYARFIKIDCKKSSTGMGFGIKEIEMMEPSGLVTLKEYYEIMAKQSPAYYPRWLLKKQAYWTGVGVEGDENEAIICEDGTVEPHKRGFTIMPFLYLDDKLITRDDAKITQSLEKNYLPIPSVKWDYDDVGMDVKLFTYGKIGESIAYVQYEIKNRREDGVSVKFFLTIRPFQIFPPWQDGGGFSPIYKIKYSNDVITINDEFKVVPLIKPTAFGAIAGGKYFKLPFKIPSPPEPEGDITCFIKKGVVPEEKNVEDTDGFASSALGYDFELGAGESKEFFVAIPLHDKMPSLDSRMKQSAIKARFERMLKENIAFWESKVNKVGINIPETDIVDTLKSNIAYSLITKDGPGLQPGSRSYDKTWMRDGGMAAVALLRMGLTSEVREFIDWYSKFQLETGEVPPIIDTKAKDPLWEEKEKGLIEYDSQGEFIYTILQYYYFTGDKKFLEDKLPKVVKDLEFLVYLRNKTLTPEFKDASAEKRKYYGILPPSTSHEGYWREYSYWDDLWALKGWKDAKTIFAILGREDLVKWADKEYADFKKCFYDSVDATMKFYKVDYIPASASLGDFDPTSTAVAIMYCDELENLPQRNLKNTFDRYYKDLRSRFEPNAKYRFTPYELRSAPAFLYMGEGEKSLELLRFMLKCRRPLAWNQLAEVVNDDYRFPDYFGDMPHTWVGAEYINAVRCLFVYEQDDKLILGHGIDEQWLSREEGMSVSNMPTYYGDINYSVKKEGDALRIKVWGEKVTTPPNGFVFKLPLAEEIREITLNGEKLEPVSDKELTFFKLPLEAVVYYLKNK